MALFQKNKDDNMFWKRSDITIKNEKKFFANKPITVSTVIGVCIKKWILEKSKKIPQDPFLRFFFEASDSKSPKE